MCVCVCVFVGGHTAEVLRVLRYLSGDKYRPRVYAVSSTDEMSAQRALRMEKEVFSSNKAATSCNDDDDEEEEEAVKVVRIPRSREVGQSYLSSIFTTLYSFFASIKMVALERPTLVRLKLRLAIHPLSLSLSVPFRLPLPALEELIKSHIVLWLWLCVSSFVYGVKLKLNREQHGSFFAMVQGPACQCVCR